MPLTLVLLSLFVLSGFVNSSQAQSSGPAPVAESINIEVTMRVWQERYNRVTGGFIAWPANLNGDLPGLYPENCFYAEDLRDPARATALVQSLATAMSMFQDELGYNDPREVPILDYYYLPPEDALNVSDKTKFYRATIERGIPLAEIVFERDPNFRNLYVGLRLNSPLSNITVNNYVGKFTEMAYLLSQANILIQPASFVAEEDSKSVGVTATNEDISIAREEALTEFSSKFSRSSSAFSNKIGLTLETVNTASIEDESDLFSSRIVWQAGRYRLDLSDEWETASYYPFILNQAEGYSTDELFIIHNIDNYMLYPPLDEFTYQRGEYKDKVWFSPLYEPPGPDQISFPAGLPLRQRNPIGDRNSLHAFMVKEIQWAHHIDGPSSAFIDCCDSCGEGGSCVAEVNTAVESLLATIGFGSDAQGSLGNLVLHADVPSPELVTPAALYRNFREDVRSIVDYTQIIPGRNTFSDSY